MNTFIEIIKWVLALSGILAWIAVAFLSRRSANSYSRKQPLTRDELDGALQDMGVSTLLMDGFEDAVIGFSQRISEPILVVYSWQKMVDILVERDGMDYDEAVEYVDFNCLGAWVGDETPIIVVPFPDMTPFITYKT